MNTILQKRIEEAKQKEYPLPPMVDGAVCKVLAMAEQTAYKKGATFALQNQWISVEEALPNESGDYLVIVRQSRDSEAYFYEISTYNATDNIWFYVGKLVVTQWALIPSLEGGKK